LTEARPITEAGFLSFGTQTLIQRKIPMSKPRTANPALAISEADLASALALIGTEIHHQPLRSSALARVMRETFLGSDAGGAWDWRMAYDLMQAAAVQVLLREASDGSSELWAGLKGKQAF
jgi:hypothetical protein